MVVATTKRVSHRHCRYKGDLREWLKLGDIKGPNALNEMMTVVEVSYDPETNVTTAGFDWTRVWDYPAHPDYPWGEAK